MDMAIFTHVHCHLPYASICCGSQRNASRLFNLFIQWVKDIECNLLTHVQKSVDTGQLFGII